MPGFCLTKKALYRQIEEQRRIIERISEERDHFKARSALLDAAKLPKCESLACLNCRKAVYQRNEYGELFLIGCGKDRVCKEYEQTPSPSVKEQLEAMLAQGALR